MQYRKKPVVIEAVEILHSNEEAIFALVGTDNFFKEGFKFGMMKPDGTFTENPFEVGGEWGVLIPTLEGTMFGRYKDYLIKGVNGEFYPCKPDIFEKTYEKV